MYVKINCPKIVQLSHFKWLIYILSHHSHILLMQFRKVCRGFLATANKRFHVNHSWNYAVWGQHVTLHLKFCVFKTKRLPFLPQRGGLNFFSLVLCNVAATCRAYFPRFLRSPATSLMVLGLAQLISPSFFLNATSMFCPIDRYS